MNEGSDDWLGPRHTPWDIANIKAKSEAYLAKIAAEELRRQQEEARYKNEEARYKNEAELVELLRKLVPVDKSQRKKMTVAQANVNAMILAKKKKQVFFLLSTRMQAELIGCAYATWKKTEFCKKAMETRERLEHAKQNKKTTSRKAEDYNEAVAAKTAQGGDDGLNKLVEDEKAELREKERVARKAKKIAAQKAKETAVLTAQQRAEDDQDPSNPQKRHRAYKRA